MRPSLFQLFAGVLAAPLLFIASTASAHHGPESCGNLDLAAQGNCKLEVEGGCTAKCEPVAFELSCGGKCSVSAEASCTASCGVDCQAECDIKPAEFDCTASCGVDCTAECEGSCEASANKANCKGKCSAKCDASCSAECTVEPGSVDCKAKCDASCSGSCEVKADVDCHVSCEAELQGGCEAACKAPEGALYCNGQFISVPDLDDCLAYLVEINVEVSGYAECKGNTCEAGGEVEAALCSVNRVGGSPWDVGAITALAVGAGLIVARRQNRRS